MTIFAQRFNIALEKRGKTAADISKKTNIYEGTLSNYKSGKYAPKQKNLEMISDALNVSIAWLLGADVPMEKSLPENIISLPKTKKVALLGTIACGEPITADENIENYITVDADAKIDFALKCKGDSMINARIFDGDIVYIHSQPDVENGEIGAVLIDNEATLKRIYKYPNKLILSPCNPLYDDIIYKDEELENVRILGKATMFVSVVR